MSPDFNYSEVPATFLHCLNKQCKHSAKCMRYLECVMRAVWM